MIDWIDRAAPEWHILAWYATQGRVADHHGIFGTSMLDNL